MYHTTLPEKSLACDIVMTLTNNFNEDSCVDKIQRVIPKKDEVMNTMGTLDVDNDVITTVRNNKQKILQRKYHQK